MARSPKKPKRLGSSEARRRVAAAGSTRSLDLSGLALASLPAEVTSLTSLRTLDLSGTGINDVAPLAVLTALEALDVGKTRVADARPLVTLKALEVLNLVDTQIADVAPLAQLTGLQMLNLGGTRVIDVSPLAGLTALETLFLSRTEISDIGPLAALNNLESLSLWNSNVTNIAPLAKMAALQTLYLSGTSIVDIAPLANLAALESLDLSHTGVTNVGPLAGLTTLKSLDLAGTNVTDCAPLGHLSELRSLDLQDSSVANIGALSRLTSLSDASVSNELLGLIYDRTAAVRGWPFDEFARLPNPMRTVETINFLRRQQGLPEYFPQGYERSGVFDGPNLDGLPEAAAAQVLEQRPATFEFSFDGQRLRAKPQRSNPDNAGISTDIYEEVKAKALQALSRLATTNAPLRTRDTVARLLEVLGDTLQDVAPGKLLMRSRSLDADVAAFDTIDGRREIAEDVLSQLLDLANSVGDFKSCYPAITRLEAARVAQHLLTKDVDAALMHMADVRSAAAASPVVDLTVIAALDAGQPEIDHAAEIINQPMVHEAALVAATQERAEIAALMTLDTRNFIAGVVRTASTVYDRGTVSVSAAAKGAGKVLTKTGREFVKKVLGPLSDAAVATAVAALAGAVVGPAAGLAGFLLTYKALAKQAEAVVNARKKPTPRKSTTESKGPRSSRPKKTRS